MLDLKDVEKPGLRDKGFSEIEVSKDYSKSTVWAILTTF